MFNAWPREKHEELVQLYAEGWSTKKLGEKYKIHRRSITYHLVEKCHCLDKRRAATWALPARIE